MKERPILFSGPMVRATLEGPKTQTRRVIRPDWWRCLEPDDEEDRQRAVQVGPYGVPGDRLWVRETWAAADEQVDGVHRDDPVVVVYRADGTYQRREGAPITPTTLESWNEEDAALVDRWRPSIFMPRWASRLLLEVTEVRVQRVQEISEEDARAEGVKACARRVVGLCDGCSSYVCGFRQVWAQINGKRAPWADNPWVWAVTFRIVDAPAAQ